uniref:Uncharacterized protein n=1 Tax=Branchiostoma floridae TaxID=7739 RepID=C3ZTR6_BRAFL|eukprot:XP_002588053.1 hypothetical protein BRAFLDRAFT_83034 [Branchiostoma floridae]
MWTHSAFGRRFNLAQAHRAPAPDAIHVVLQPAGQGPPASLLEMVPVEAEAVEAEAVETEAEVAVEAMADQAEMVLATTREGKGIRDKGRKGPAQGWGIHITIQNMHVQTFPPYPH